MNLNTERAIHELKHHSPFTITAAITATIFVFLLKDYLQKNYNNIFEYSHFIHLLISSIVPSAMFYKYRKNISKSIIIGVTSAIILGSLSDILFPFLISNLLGIKTEFHLPLFENTIIVMFIVITGSILGIIAKITKIPHFIHIFISVFASLFYLLAFASYSSIYFYILTSIIVFISVIIPCCLADIIFPVIFLKKDINKCKICEH